MTHCELLLLALALAVDAFAISIAVALLLNRASSRQIFRLSFHFALFQALMPLVGYLGGRSLGALITGWDHWLAFSLLTAIGAKAIYEAFHKENWQPNRDPTRGASLILLSLACSIDALAVGVTLGLMNVSILYSALVIGLVCGLLCTAGMLFGARLGRAFGKRVEIAGGAVLIGIGANLLVQHLT